MSAYVRVAVPNTENLEDEVEFRDGEFRHAYRILETGVLQVLRLITKGSGNAWVVLYEYAPTYWKRVHGTRFVDVDKDDELAGTHGAANKTALDWGQREDTPVR